MLSQALVQYPDGASAANAKQALQGHAIYAGGFNRVSKLRLNSPGQAVCFKLTAGSCCQGVKILY